MYILIEGYDYPAQDVRDITQGIALENNGKIKTEYVGYFYNSHPNICDCVFVLPKVLLELKNGEELVFGKYRPDNIICINGNSPLEEREKNFIYDFSVWIYRAVVVFNNDKRNNTEGVYHKAQVNKGRKQRNNTFLDILLALIRFCEDNQQFFMFIIKNMHAGFNKINWTRTIARTSAVVQDNNAIYVNPVNKKRQINFDEELLVIFFSILNYIHEHYGFPVSINCNYELITGRKFQNYLNGFGKIRLQQIKYKYFSDKALHLWKLCYAFFERAKSITLDIGQKDYLLVKDFNIVFEAIIDELIGEKNIPRGLKEQEDGKRVDHMYTYKGLATHAEDKPIYYIGDSKYYKRGSRIDDKSVAKQFTYARNVIQWNLNLFMKGNPEDEDWQEDWKQFREVGKLRDDATEGYNIIPNFFISATMEEDLSYRDTIRLTEKEEKYFTSDHFNNRLFDRDTLLVCHYDVNFLFVVSLYALNNRLKKEGWKKKVRDMFREEIQKMLQEKYDFYAMRSLPNEDGMHFIKTHFQDVLGKIYAPFETTEYLSLALDNKDPDGNNEQLMKQLEQFFIVAPCKLGENPRKAIEELIKKTPEILEQKPQEKNVLTGLVRKTDSTFKVFSDHKATSYTMETVPNINLMGIKFFLPMVCGSIDGYYEVTRVGLTTYDGNPALRLRLGRYIPIGEEWIPIYRSKMQPGELISYDYTLKLYNGEI